MNAVAGKAIAAVGVVLAFVTIWIEEIHVFTVGASYWSSDGTIGAFALGGACLAALLLAAGFAGRSTTGELFAVGAVLLGFYLFTPVALAFDDWDKTRAGAWLAICAGALIMIGAGISYLAAGTPRETPAGMSPLALIVGLGIALVFPGTFLDATSSGDSYWSSAALGHSLGIFLLILAIACGLTWAARLTGKRVRRLDSALTLVLLGFVSYSPVGAAFGDFGSLGPGAWLALGGGILAAGGTWAAHETPRTGTAAA